MRAPDRSPVPANAGLTSWRIDAVIAAGLCVVLVACVVQAGQLTGTDNILGTLCGILICSCVAVRRGHPHLAASVAAAGGALLGLANSASLADSVLIAPVFLLAYSLGSAADLRRSAAVGLLVAVGLQLAVGVTTFNPFVVVVLVAGIAVGLVGRSRRKLTEQLTARGAELEAERAVFAAEAVRYERARIARELHDIVAHSVSVMVIQASAGQRLTATDPASAADAFDAIAEMARQAGADIARLVELLDQDSRQRAANAVQLIGELAARAAATGLGVTCRFTGSADGLSAEAADTAFRLVQEGLTNALKHAPGAPVEIVVAGAGEDVEISVRNGPAAGPPSGLELTGGGRGLAGMRERVAVCGGEIIIGPAADGGWQVLARLPRHESAQAR